MGPCAPDDFVHRRLALLGRRELLQRGFRMLRRAALAYEVRFPQPEDESLGRCEAAVDEERADQRLDHVAHDILALAGAIASCLLAEPDDLRNADLAAVLSASLARNEYVVAARHEAFRLVWVAVVERLGDHHAEDAVAEEFQPLVMISRATGGARMSQRQFEQGRVLRIMGELVPDELNYIRSAHSASPV